MTEKNRTLANTARMRHPNFARPCRFSRRECALSHLGAPLARHPGGKLSERAYTRQSEQLSLTIFAFVTVMWPCSVEFLPTPCSFASPFTSSFAPCIAALETTPVTVIVCPTCGASLTASLLTSHVPPSLVVKV